jgi:putative DNA primase/helicase
MAAEVAAKALGHWDSILRALGVDEVILTGKHQPCPGCGGDDRFRYDNKERRGDYYCNSCGPGDGFRLLELIFGWDFKNAANQVEAIITGISPDAPRAPRDHTVRLQRIQSEILPVEKPVIDYLRNRGLSSCPPTLRYHPSLRYYRSKEDYTEYPAMVAKVVSNTGVPVGYHLTYLQNGAKAPEKSPRKMIGEPGSEGSVVRLYKPKNGLIGLAEGIETALAAKELFGIPVWSVLNTSGLDNFEPPQGITEVVIFADSDSAFGGQASAFGLARRLKTRGFYVEVELPPALDTDWLDELSSRKNG